MVTLHWDSESSWNRKQSKQQYLALGRNFPRSAGIASFLFKVQVFLSGLLSMAPEDKMLYNVSKLNIPSWIFYITPFLIISVLKMKGDRPETLLPSGQADFVRSPEFAFTRNCNRFADYSDYYNRLFLIETSLVCYEKKVQLEFFITTADHKMEILFHKMSPD